MRHLISATPLVLAVLITQPALTYAAMPTLDIVFANEGGRNRVCLGDGVGGFSCSDVSTNTDSSWGVGLGFVDSNETIDAVFANYLNQTNRVCLGDGEGGFACSDTSTDVNDTRYVALGNVDGDDILDVVFANSNGFNRGWENRVCLGDKVGDFACDNVTADRNASYGVALGRVDDNQTLDAVFANIGRHRVCLGNGAGGFTCSDVGTETYWSEGVALGYVDGDQALDAVFVATSGPNRVCLGDGIERWTQSFGPFST